MTRLLTRFLALGVISALAMVILSSCTVKDRMAVMLVDGALVFQTCSAEDMRKILVEVDDYEDPGSESFTAWEASGALFPADAPVGYGVLPPGLSNETGPIEFEPTTHRIWFSLSDNHDDSAVVGVFDGRELAELQWLNQDGRLVDEVC